MNATLELLYLSSAIIGLTSLLIYGLIRRSNDSKNVLSNVGTCRPPLVKYSLPWVGSAIEMGKDQDTFFKRASSELGPVFTVKTVGQEITYITSPDLIRAIYRDVKTFEFTPIRHEILEKVFGVPHATAYSSFMTDVYNPMHHAGLSPRNVVNLLKSYTRYACESVLKAVDKFDGSTTILVPFIVPPAYQSACYAFFGRGFDVEKSYKPFRTFDDQFHVMFTGVPKFMIPWTHRAWDQVCKIFQEYIGAPHEDASEMIQLLEATARDADIPTEDIARIFASQFWALQANAIYAAYWVIALELQKPQGLAALIAEVDRARLDWKTSHPNQSPDASQYQWLHDASLPLLTSTILEALRLSTSTFSIRRVNQSVNFAGFHLEVGERIICVTRAVHLDDEIHPNPHEFDSQRYLEGRNKFSKNEKMVPNHSMPFGGGVSMCEGRHFAMGEMKVLLALILTYAIIEVDTSSDTRPKYFSARIGVGVMPPAGDLSVKISKRKDII